MRRKAILIVQHKSLYWGKDCRGAPPATLRARWPLASVLPTDFFLGLSQGQTPVHCLSARQSRDKGIAERSQRFCYGREEEPLRIGAVELIRTPEGWEVRYRDDWWNARPSRRQSDPVRGVGPLREQAFFLEMGEMGRVVVNGRHVLDDTGVWTYQMDVVNLLVWPDPMPGDKRKKAAQTEYPPCTCLTARPVDKLYDQRMMLQ